MTGSLAWKSAAGLRLGVEGGAWRAVQDPTAAGGWRMFHLDEGAAQVLKAQGKSLLPVGVRALEGSFGRGDLVVCVDSAGNEVARGLCNYDADDARRILGAKSDEIAARLGGPGEPEMIHRDNLVLSG